MRGFRAYFVSHRAYWHRIRKHTLFTVAAWLWGLFAAVSLILPFSPHLEAWFYGLSYLPKWPWYVWVIGLLSLALIAVVEASRSEIEDLSQRLADQTRPVHAGSELPDLYRERKRVQDELEKLESATGPPILRARSLLTDWLDRERARKVESKKNELLMIDDLLSRTVSPKNEAPASVGPNVVVEYSYQHGDRDMTGHKPLILKNISPTDAAKNVRILPLKVADLTATFEPDIIPFIEPLGRKEAKVLIEGVFPPLRHHLPELFVQGYKDQSTDELFTPQSHPLLVEYEDAANNLRFETCVSLRYTRYHTTITVGETIWRMKPSH